MRRLNESLSARARRQLSYARVAGYATFAVKWPEEEKSLDGWSPRIDDALRAVLTEIAGGAWSVADARLLGEVESRTGEYFEAFDEEPIGAAYYPYFAVLLILMGLPILTRSDPEVKLVNSLWEYSTRFVSHVDWELRKSRILTEEPDAFRMHEERVWLQASRLDDESVNAFDELVMASRKLAVDCLEVLPFAFREEAAADYVVVSEDAGQRSLADAFKRKPQGLRMMRGRSIYTSHMDDAYRTYFQRPAYLYVWGSKEALADFLRGAAEIRTLVDLRRLDGMVVDGASFMANPIESTSSW
jgi:hypothetical protein